MSPVDVERQLAEQVMLRAYDDKYIDRNEEREILQIALQHGATTETARATLAQVCDSHDYVLESRVLGEIREMIARSVRNDGKLAEKDFNEAVAACRRKLQGKVDDARVKRTVVEMIEEGGYKVKTGLFSNWFARVKKEVGAS